MTSNPHTKGGDGLFIQPCAEVYRLRRFIDGENPRTVYKLPPTGRFDPMRQDMAAVLESRADLLLALRKIATGSEDTIAPLRAMGPDQMRSVARAALAKADPSR